MSDSRIQNGVEFWWKGTTPSHINESRWIRLRHNCPNWKSLGFCSHTVAVAEVNKKLNTFVAFLYKNKINPNVTNLVTCAMPRRGRGRGRKGGVALRSRKSHEAPSSRVSMNIGVSEVDTAGSTTISHFSPISVVNQTPGYFQPEYGPTVYASPQYSYPYPYAYQSTNMLSAPGFSNPFTLCFIKGNIANCFGCHNRYPKSPQPRFDSSIKSGDSSHHKE